MDLFRPNSRSNEYCRRAEEILQQSFLRLRRESEESPSDLGALRTSIEQLPATTARKDISLMARLSQTLTGRPRLSLGLGLAVALLAFLTLVPFSYNVTVGYTVGSTELDATLPFNMDAYAGAMESMGYNDVSINRNVNGDKATFQVTGLKTEIAAENAAMVLNTMTNMAAKPAIHPITRAVSGSLYAQAMDRYFTVEFDTDGLTEAEIVESIKASLAAQGATNSEVNVITTEDGSTQIEISIDSEE